MVFLGIFNLQRRKEVEANHVVDFDLPYYDDLNVMIDTSITSEEDSLQLIKKFIKLHEERIS